MKTKFLLPLSTFLILSVLACDRPKREIETENTEIEVEEDEIEIEDDQGEEVELNFKEDKEKMLEAFRRDNFKLRKYVDSVDRELEKADLGEETRDELIELKMELSKKVQELNNKKNETVSVSKSDWKNYKKETAKWWDNFKDDFREVEEELEQLTGQ